MSLDAAGNYDDCSRLLLPTRCEASPRQSAGRQQSANVRCAALEFVMHLDTLIGALAARG